VTPYTFTSAGMPVAGLTEGAGQFAARSAGRDHGVRMAYIFDIAGEYGRARPRFGTLEHALEVPARGAGGLRAGRESSRRGPGFHRGVPVGVFASGPSRAGLHSVPPRGREMSGSGDDLGGPWTACTPSGSGTASAAMDDPVLVARLR